MKQPKELEILAPYFVEKLKPIAGVKTIQLVIFREVLDYTVLRTEEDRQLNSAVTIKSVDDQSQVSRAIFLGGKQKAVESRQLERLLRTAAEEEGLRIEECYLKDHLCLECPRCGLFGGTNASSNKSSKSNIKHRISYSSAYSIDLLDDISEGVTFNGISDKTQATGQTLGERVSITPGTLFPSIVTLTSITWKELVLVIKTLLTSKKYGAETRIGGDVRNHIVAITAGWEEIITPLEITLFLAKDENYDATTVIDILENVKEDTGYPDKILTLNEVQTREIIDFVRKFPLNKPFLEEIYSDVKEFRKIQES